MLAMFRKIFPILLYLCLGLNAQDLDKMAAQLDVLIQKQNHINKVKAVPTVDDATFARRVYLDAIGRIPTFDELQTFLSSTEKNKRNALIDKLMDSPGYASHNFNYWADVFRVVNRVTNWLSGHNYAHFIKKSLHEDKAYDQFVRELLTAKGAANEMGNGATGYYLRDTGMPLDNMANSMKIFLGTDISCAQCHDHPFEDWTQMDFYKLAAFTSGVQTDPSYNGRYTEYPLLNRSFKSFIRDKKLKLALKQVRRTIVGVSNGGTGMIRLPHDYDYDDAKPFDMVKAQTPYGKSVNLVYSEIKDQNRNKKTFHGKDINARKAFADWVTSTDNPMFTKVIVNRMWHKLMGTELCGPVLDLSLDSEGKNPHLLKGLVHSMKKLNYSLKDFSRLVMRTKLYQQKLQVEAVESAQSYFGPSMKRLSSEQVWDSLLSLLLENPDKTVSFKSHMNEYGVYYNAVLKSKGDAELVNFIKSGSVHSVLKKSMSSQISKKHFKHDKFYRDRFIQGLNKRASELGSPAPPNHFLRLFGQSERLIIESANTEASVPQALALLNSRVDEIILDKNSQLNKTLSHTKSDSEKINKAFLSVLGRKPSAGELNFFKTYLSSKPDQGLKNLAWALVNSNEFLFRR